MPSDKEKILAMNKNQPNDASFDDKIEAPYINHKINIGIDQLKNGNSLSLNQLREQLKLGIELDKKDELKEQIGWLSLAEQTLQKLWNNKKDEVIWNDYL